MPLNSSYPVFEAEISQGHFEYFRTHGYVVLKDALTSDELTHFLRLYDIDREKFGPPNCWHPFDEYQTRNCNALVTSPGFDALLRHPKILPLITFLMGGPVCFSEICLRHMAPYDGESHQHFHRDRLHWENHPLRMDYMQLMLYLTEVDESTHCFSISPESVYNSILDGEAQLGRNGCVDFHGPAGTIVLFNIALFHTATVRKTQKERKTVQAYYGHRFRPYLSNCSVIPPCFWRNANDPEVRAFYGNLNDASRIFQAAFSPGSG